MNNAALVSPSEHQTIMIVSSHAHLREHYASILGQLDARLVVVSDAFEALDVLRAESIHAVFSDFNLSGFDALGLFVFMRELHLSIPLVLCASDFKSRHKAEAETLGVFRIVRKPTSAREIQAGVCAALEERERQLLQFYC